MVFKKIKEKIKNLIIFLNVKTSYNNEKKSNQNNEAPEPVLRGFYKKVI